MTAIPGHNIVLQQSGAAQEAANQAHSPKPSPEQIASQQAAGELVKNTTVQEFDESEKMRAKREKDALKRRQELKAARKKEEKEEMDQDPDAPGRLLDTIV